MENKLTFEEFIVRASVYQIQERDQRLGQSYMNSLSFHRPDLYDEVMGMDLSEIWKVNPYYSDAIFPKFLAFIAERW
jgi:hypothetical protein